MSSRIDNYRVLRDTVLPRAHKVLSDFSKGIESVEHLSERMLAAGWRGQRSDGSADPIATTLNLVMRPYRFVIGFDYFVMHDEYGTQISGAMPVEYCSFVRLFDRGAYPLLDISTNPIPLGSDGLPSVFECDSCGCVTLGGLSQRCHICGHTGEA